MSIKKYKELNPQANFSEIEKEILKYWEESHIFQKSLDIRKDAKKFSFFDGPPFATGTPHYGHIVASTIKDVIPRYWTMKGYFVERKWGWDCHGLPIENIAEKELGITQKKQIEDMGVKKFNDFCRSKVLEYVNEWKTVINRLGRFADMDNAYKTMDLSYMESVWWVFKELWNKGLVYEGYRSMHICTRCETTLSQSEVAEGYKTIKDLSATAKFKLKDQSNTHILAWTTTPWTLIGNVALAIGKNIDYVSIKTQDGQNYILAKEALKRVIKDQDYQITNEFKGSDLIGKEYEPIFPYHLEDQDLINRGNGWKIYPADFVNTEEGTGVVHVAPAFGEDDLNLSIKEKLPFIQHAKMDGIIKSGFGEFSGLSVKPADDMQKTDVEIIKYLAGNNLLFAKEKYEHSYPHCWRCDTPLINYATTSWFVAVTKVKEEALKTAKEINWFPKYIKEGRFGKWLEGSRDWSISRQRFWASVIPIWKCECGNLEVLGSVKELEEKSGQHVTDIHKDSVDNISWKCEKCQGVMKRIPDVLDTWFDSASMPYAQIHYPYENKDKFAEYFPADFIAEGADQTRAWFYYLHIISTALFKQQAFKQVVVNGIVLAEDGKKMSKRLQNYPDPMEMFNKYGADAVRFYLLSSPVVAAENLNFTEKDIIEIPRGMFRMLWNSYSFFVLYANIDGYTASSIRHSGTENSHVSRIHDNSETDTSKNFLDQWIISELQILVKEVNISMSRYDLSRSARLFPIFIDKMSNWYIRRSRKRFWKAESDEDKEQAYNTLNSVLITLSKLMAPFTPFISEEIYRNLTGEESVHLTDYPEPLENLIDTELTKQMEIARQIVEMGLAARNQAKIKVRQPLSKVIYNGNELPQEVKDIIADELNVKSVEIMTNSDDSSNEKLSVNLDTTLTDDLIAEGEARELVRQIQQSRKSAGFDISDRIIIYIPETSDSVSKIFDKFGEYIQKETLAVEILFNEPQSSDYSGDILLQNKTFKIHLKKN